jgi:hypothetical protein
MAAHMIRLVRRLHKSAERICAILKAISIFENLLAEKHSLTMLLE